MLKQKEYKIEDSNIANLGSDLDKKVRVAAASTEKAWTEAGKKIGLQIWRIEKFNVKSVDPKTYGTFYSGDSYITLNTYKKKESEKFFWDIHFWLGKYTSQDEAGTAAYKTVELDDLLGGEPVQHREVQGHESSLFLSYFKEHTIHLLDGGIESGFRHVEPEKYQKRLLHVKGKRRIRVTQVDCTHKSLNSGDVFILDLGTKIYQWNGSTAGALEKNKAANISHAIKDEREGKATVTIFEEKGNDLDEFWSGLGDKGPVQSAQSGGEDNEDKKWEKVLFQLSDASGTFSFKEIAKGAAVKKELLKTEDVFILDAGMEVFAWIGRKSSSGERKHAMQHAQQYLVDYKKPAYMPIARVLEGGENEVFDAFFRADFK